MHCTLIPDPIEHRITLVITDRHDIITYVLCGNIVQFAVTASHRPGNLLIDLLQMIPIYHKSRAINFTTRKKWATFSYTAEIYNFDWFLQFKCSNCHIIILCSSYFMECSFPVVC